MDPCPFMVLGLKPAPQYDENDIKRAFRKRALEVHPDKTKSDDPAPFQQLSNAQDHLLKDCASAFDNWVRRNGLLKCQICLAAFDRSLEEDHYRAHGRWCEICRSPIKDDRDHSVWHRCCVFGCGVTGIFLFNHLVDKHQFERCTRCPQAKSLRHLELFHRWWRCGACDGYIEAGFSVEEATFARILHLDHHLLRMSPGMVGMDREALDSYVQNQQYRRCPACNVIITMGKIIHHLTNSHSFIACDDCPGLDDGIGDHVLSAHPMSRCQECEENHQQDRLQIHLRLCHSYERCPHCTEVVSPNSFGEHMQDHAQEEQEDERHVQEPKNFPCRFCTKSFNSLGYRRVHTSIKHREENRGRGKKQPCLDCGKNINTSFMNRHRGSKQCRRK